MGKIIGIYKIEWFSSDLKGAFGMQKVQEIDKNTAFFVKGFTINSEFDERFVKPFEKQSVSLFLSGYWFIQRLFNFTFEIKDLERIILL